MTGLSEESALRDKLNGKIFKKACSESKLETDPKSTDTFEKAIVSAVIAPLVCWLKQTKYYFPLKRKKSLCALLLQCLQQLQMF